MDDLKKDILKDVRRIQEEMDLLFDHFYKIRHSPVLTTKKLWRPSTEVFETEHRVMEINYGIFEGNIHLPESIDPQNVKAEYRDGLLEIRLDKKARILCLEKGKRAKAKEIEIEWILPLNLSLNPGSGEKGSPWIWFENFKGGVDFA